jgi:YD repeat-containing protein
MMPSRLKNKLLFITTIAFFLFTLCLPSYSRASNYSHDNGNRLIRVDYENGSKIEYTYDESGNRTQMLTTSSTATPLLQVTVKNDAQNTLPGLHLYLFNEAGSYLGLTQVTNASGVATFEVPAGNYKIRADYLGYQFWSEIVNFSATSDLTMLIAQMDVQVNITTANGTAEGVKVYLFTAAGSYLGIYSVTDASGNATFKLPIGGRYKVRTDIMGSQYWSDVLLVAGGGINNVAVATGGGMLQANILQAAGVPLANVTAYLFSGSGSYLGMNQKSDAAGKVSFAVPQGIYKIRTDYMGYQFWSDTNLVGANVTIDLLIAHKDVGIVVGGVFQGVFTPLGGINVYLYNSTGSYMGKTFKTDAAGKVVFSVPQKAYKVRADYMGQQYWSEEFIWLDKVVNIPLADAVVTVTGSAMPHVGVPVYVYTQAKSYLGVTGQTAADGKITFRLPAGTYKFRADYQGNQFWSVDQTLIADQSKDVNISTGGGNFSLTVKANSDLLAGVKCYVYNDKNAYLGVMGTTDANGKVIFAIVNGAYKFRVDYLGYQFWSSVTNVPATLDLTMVIPMSAVVVNVGAAYGATSGVKVYLYSEIGSYLGVYALTDAEGNVTFSLPVGGHYKLRYDILGNQYWSDVIIVADGGANNIAVNAGGGMLQVNILKAAGVPLTGVTAYLFNQNGSYLGISQTADAAGKVAFNVPRATYKVRVDYLGYQFWSPDNVVNSDMITDLTIPHKDVTITVGGLYQGAFTPMANVNVYLYNSLGSYMGKTLKTDAAGSSIFNLPEKAYTVRADYMGQQYWSEEFTWLDKAVNIPLADAAITMIGAGMPRADVPVYVYSSTKSYLGMTAKTSADGKVTFRIPAGTYKFRADYQTNQFWTDDQTIVADQINNVSLSDGGGNFTLRVKANANPLSGVKCYAYSSGGAYLGLSGVTNGNGQYIFELSTGNYKIRVDYMGYSFWTDVYSVPTQQASEFTIELSDTPVTVNAFYRNSRPLSDLNVYLFIQAGAYVNIKNVTDANGGVVFSIPNKDYKIRIDYLGRQFWANIVKGQSSPVVINEGLARVYAHKTAGPVTGATVYLFSESGEYLGVNAATDTDGNAEFTLPAYSFKFRVDVAGVQYWSQIITIVEGVELVVDVSAD